MQDSYVCCFDIETQQKITDMPGRFRDDKIKLLDISCASTVMIKSDICLDPADRERAMESAVTKTFWVDGGSNGESLADMCALLTGAELIVGYNLAGFDWLTTKKYFSDSASYNSCREKTLDVFSRIRDATSVWYKLDNLLKINALQSKTADGLQAIQWWADGERELLKEYCEIDTQQCMRLALLPALHLGGGRTISNYNFGIASALASIRTRDVSER